MYPLISIFCPCLQVFYHLSHSILSSLQITMLPFMKGGRSRRQLLRGGTVLILLLMVAAWLNGWLSTHPNMMVYIVAPKDLTQRGSQVPRTEAPVRLPVVYLDADVKNMSQLYQQTPIIPHIIHQTWKSYQVAPKFASLVKSWRAVHPTWQYWYWTDADAARFIKLQYPAYYDMYTKYSQKIHRADAMRYFILHHFGGVYADMDIRAIRPIDSFTHHHHCLISQEPWAHTRLFWNKNRLACNAFMAARPGHPFFAMLIKSLPESNRKTSRNEVMDKTGPKMVDRLVSQYESVLKNTNYNISATVYLADPDAFLPTVAANALAIMKKKCTKPQNDPKKQAICDRYRADKFTNRVPAGAFTNHEWVHTYYGIDEKRSIDIFSIIPDAVNVKKMLDEMEKKKQG